MKNKLYALILLALTLPGSGFAQASKPLAERQQEFLSWKFGMYIHYGLASYNQGQWATGYEDPGTFAPTQLDCGQWADAAKAAGMKYAVFTTKHTSGYALWDSKYLLNVPPDRTGRIPEWLVRRLEEIGQEWEATKPVTPMQRLQRAMKELDAAKTPENR